MLGPDEVAYDGFTRVVHRRLRLPTGGEVVWDLVDTPATVAVLPLTPEGLVVVVAQYRPGPGRVVVSVPGGLVDRGETPEAAGARELLEETGYRAASLEVVGAVSPTNATRPWYAAVARGCVRVGEQALDEHEDIEVAEIPLAELRSELRAGRLGSVAQTYLALDHAGLL